MKESAKINIKLFVIMGLTWGVEFAKATYEQITKDKTDYNLSLVLNSINLFLVSKA